MGACVAWALCTVGCDPMIHLGAETRPSDASTQDVSAEINDGVGVDGSDVHVAGEASAQDVFAGVDGRTVVPWSATFEPGDFSEWEADGQGGAYQLSVPPTVSTEQAHSGTHSAKLTISPVNGLVDYVYLFRGTAGSPPAEPEAYYGAWFYIPKPYLVSMYWNVFHFLYGTTPDRQDLKGIWDLDLRSSDTGELIPYVWDFLARRQRDQLTPMPVQPGKWFHIEMFLRLASDATGQVSVWQDGVLVLDVSDVVTSPTPWLQWSVGNTSLDITPTPADLYIDDVTLSLSRVGP